MFTAYPQHIHTILFTITLPSILTLLFIYASFTQCDIFSQLLHKWLYNNVYSISLAYTYSTIYNYTTQYTNCAVYIYFPFHNVNIFPQYCIIVYSTMFTVRLHWTLTVLFTITIPSILSVLFTYAVLFTMWYFSSITAQLTLQQCLQHILNMHVLYCYNYSPQYTVCAVYICCPFHNVIFFHNYCTIHSTTMFTAYPQPIHTILFTITLSSILTVLFTFTFPFTMWIFFHSYYIIVYYTMFTVRLHWILTVLFTITLPSLLSVLFTYAVLFTMWYFSAITALLTLQQCLQHILNIYIRYCLQLDYPVYWLCCFYMLPLHNVTFFHNYCTIDSTTMSTAYPQHIHIVLFRTTLHSKLALLFIYASFTQCDIFSQLLHNWLYNNVYSISSTYTCGTVYNYTTQYADFLFTYAFLFTMWIFFHSYCIIVYSTMFTVRLHWILTVLFTITLPSILSVLFTYAVLFTMWYFSTITTLLTLQQCLQHILNIYIRYCLQLHYPVYWLCCLYMLPLHNVTFFHNYCTIDSTRMSNAYPQHIHIVLFTTTLHSILALLFIYASFTQCDIFSQLLHNWLYNNVYSISSTYTYDIVYNYTTQYTDFAVYICFLYTMWHFFTITAQVTLQQCLQHILSIYIQYYLQLHYPVY